MKKNDIYESGGIVISFLKKNLLKMKLTILIFLLSLVQLVASQSFAQSERLTLDLKDARVEDVLMKIEEQSNLFFIYNRDVVDVNRIVNVSCTNQKVTEILAGLFSGTDVAYEIQNRHIILKSSSAQISQTKSVSGKVTDSSGSTLPGVSVVVKGTTTGVITDTKGNFLLANISDNATLVFSFVGMKSQEISVAGKSSVNVKLEEETISLDEVVAVGYGTQSKRVVTGSIASVSMKKIDALPVTNISQALRGGVAGVQFTDNSRPGQGGTILIRGKRSITASNDPLIIVDGVPFSGSLADINANDIASMDVLKDASASAIYGSRAANGVILITSKMGTTEKPVIRFNTYYSINNPLKWLKICSPERYIQKIRDGFSENGVTLDQNLISNFLQPSEVANYEAGKTVNPWDVISQNSYTASYDLSISAKSKNTNYFISGAYVDEKGLIYNDNSKRISFRTNIETKITDWLSFGVASQFSNRDLSGKSPGITGAYRMSPFANLYDDKGVPTQYLVSEETMSGNPLYTPYYTLDEEIYQNLFANLYSIVNLPFIKGLKYRINYSPNYRWSHHYIFLKQDPNLTNNVTTATKQNWKYLDWTLENILSYNHDITKNNNIDITLMFGRNHTDYETTTATGTTFTNGLVTWNNLGQATTQTIASSAYAQEGISSMARLNYRLMNRYLLTLTGRRDGASVFAKHNKFNFCPSAALSWIATEESFMKRFEFLDLLKFRLSYGATGNQAISPYQSLDLTGTSQYVFTDGGSTAIGMYAATMKNDYLKWETTYSTNIAMDFKVLKGRIDGTLEFYNLDTKDLLMTRALPVMTGFGSILTNLGATNNKGVELTLNTINIQKNDFTWCSDIAFSANKNKIVHIYNSDANKDGIEDDDLGNLWFIGQPIDILYNYKFDGIYQSGDVLPTGYKPGWVRVKDLTNDGQFTSADRTILGTKQPKFRWSFNNDFTYKNFTLSVFVNALMGWKAYFKCVNTSSTWSGALEEGSDGTNYPSRSLNMMDFPWYTAANPSNKYASFNFTNPLGYGDVESRNFVRLQEVALSYNFPKNLLQKTKMEGLRVYVSGRNLYTWTNWPGTDPESGEQVFPTTRSVSFGLNVSF